MPSHALLGTGTTFPIPVICFYVCNVYYWLRRLSHFGSGASLAQLTGSCIRHIAVFDSRKKELRFWWPPVV